MRKNSLAYMDIQKGQDQGHPDIDAVLGLLEIDRPGVVVHIHGDFVDPGKGMEHQHIRRGQFHLLFVQDLEIFHADIILFIEETFLLHTGHVEDVQLRHHIFQR